MGYVLISDNPRTKDFYCEDSVWEKLLLAPFWDPSGTAAPSFEETRERHLVEDGRVYKESFGNWDANYLDKFGQHVEATDAASLGNTWRRLGYSSEDWISRDAFNEFISFCLSGGFRIT